MYSMVKSQKQQLIFTSSSNWGYRPKIIECISKKFETNPSESLQWKGYSEGLKGRLKSKDYYSALGKSKFSLALPGLGYDTFRLWETMTLGTIPILEKGVGLDKTVSIST
jgi:hypothetical protein